MPDRAYHIARRPRARQKHVAGDLTQDITDEQDGNACLVLGVGEVQVFLEVVQAGKGDGIAVWHLLGLGKWLRSSETYQGS